MREIGSTFLCIFATKISDVNLTEGFSKSQAHQLVMNFSLVVISVFKSLWNLFAHVQLEYSYSNLYIITEHIKWLDILPI